ncbi:hypothetical protein HYX13_04760 [Candidatus Woesearchaeota archaeon]|nr:hypothetical protein [Candidatus Woesearchaeota archaeon]
MRSYGIWANQWKERPKPFGSSTSFGYYQSFADQLGSRLDDFNYPFMGGKYTNEFVVELESLKEAGLEATAKQLRIELVELHLNIDDAFAYRIKETVKSMLPVVNEKLDESESGRYMYARGIRTVYDAIKRYRILELLKEVADKASRAGYEKTSEAANWSVLELQAAMK